jgi:hypothetical protein
MGWKLARLYLGIVLETVILYAVIWQVVNL